MITTKPLIQNPTESQIMNVLFDYYSNSERDRLHMTKSPASNNFIPSYDDIDMWRWAFTNASKKGHENLQHTYPKFLIKFGFRNFNYFLNQEVIKKENKLATKAPTARSFKEAY